MSTLRLRPHNPSSLPRAGCWQVPYFTAYCWAAAWCGAVGVCVGLNPVGAQHRDRVYVLLCVVSLTQCIALPIVRSGVLPQLMARHVPRPSVFVGYQARVLTYFVM